MQCESEYSKLFVVWKFLLSLGYFLIRDALRLRWSTKHTALTAALVIGVVIMSVPLMLYVVVFLLPMIVFVWIVRRLGVSVQIQ